MWTYYTPFSVKSWTRNHNAGEWCLIKECSAHCPEIFMDCFYILGSQYLLGELILCVNVLHNWADHDGWIIAGESCLKNPSLHTAVKSEKINITGSSQQMLRHTCNLTCNIQCDKLEVRCRIACRKLVKSNSVCF